MQIDDLSKHELVAIAVARLGGEINYVDREDIAIEVDRLAPGRFNWRKHPERIDLDAVFVALRGAKKPQNGGLLVGNNTSGWMLSPAGLNWLRGLDLSASEDAQQSRLQKGLVSAHQKAECARLRGTEAYRLFIDGKADAITLQGFFQFARVNEYFQTRARQRRYAIVDNAVMNDESLSELWTLLKQRFSEEFS